MKQLSGFTGMSGALSEMTMNGAVAAATSYVNSVQYVAITIPTGAASATATISTVGALAFILNNGFQATSAGNPAISYARVELTNTTTVTAYRNSTDATNTVVAYACVVDATSNLIASVQSGTISIAAGNTSNTATISSVNASYAVPHLLGITNAATSLSLNGVEAVVSLSGTTVTATRRASGSATVIGYTIIEFKSTACNQAVQIFSKTWTASATSTTQAITSVNTNNAILIYGGNNGGSATSESATEQYASLTNATTVTLAINAAAFQNITYNFTVVEFAAGVLKSNVQRGTTTLTAATSNTSAITSVNTAKTLLTFLRYSASQTSADVTNCVTDAALTNGTTVTVARSGSSGNVTGSWEVAEFT